MQRYITIYVNEKHLTSDRGLCPYHMKIDCNKANGAFLVQRQLDRVKNRRKWRPCSACCPP